MTVNLRNTSGSAVQFAGRTVEPDEVIHVEGTLARKQPADAYLVGEGAAARLFPHATWSNAGGSKNTQPDVTIEES